MSNELQGAERQNQAPTSPISKEVPNHNFEISGTWHLDLGTWLEIVFWNFIPARALTTAVIQPLGNDTASPSYYFRRYS
jgi:hypothetical protein